MRLTRSASRLLALTAAAGLAVGVSVPAYAAAPAPSPTGSTPVLVSGDVLSPLHLTAGPGGHSVYVADAFVGAVKRIDVSRDGASTTEVAGGLGFPAGVALQGQGIYIVGSGDSGPEEQGPTFLGRLDRAGQLTVLVDLLAVERRFNPDGQVAAGDAESNPYDVLAYRGGFIVSDAAANALIRISADGRASVLTAFPLITSGPCADADNNGDVVGCDPVPTGVALGPDGLLYVSGLGAEQIGQLWVVDPDTGAILDNLTAGYPDAPPLTDVAVAPDGSVFASSLFTNEVFRLHNGLLSVAEVEAPAGLLWMRGTLYVGSVPALFAPEGTFVPGAVYAVPAGAFTPVT